MNDPLFPPTMTIAEAQDKLRGMVDDGHTCPVCTQYARVYRRKITAPSALTLIVMYREAGIDWCHLPTLAKLPRLRAVAHQGGYLNLTGHWGLMAEERAVRDDGGRAGYWRVTERGGLFVRDRVRVAKYARLYDGRCLGLQGEPVSIRDCLGEKFNYDELMGGG